jgi:hypothetical protein
MATRLRQDRFSSDRSSANNALKTMLTIIHANIHHLQKVDRNGKMEEAARDFHKRIVEGNDTDVSPKVRAYIESIYEKTMEGAALPAVRTHIDKKRRGLKFG